MEPLQPPEAVHEVALVLDHVNVLLPLLATVVGFALKLTVGACGALTVTTAVRLVLPCDALLQVSVNDVVA